MTGEKQQYCRGLLLILLLLLFIAVVFVDSQNPQLTSGNTLKYTRYRVGSSTRLTIIGESKTKPHPSIVGDGIGSETATNR